MSEHRIEDLADSVLTKWEDGDDPRSLTVVLAEELAAAEERGRRAGIEEERERWKYSQRVIVLLVQRLDNIALISKAEQERLDPRIVIETVVKHDGTLMIRLARDLSESALAGDKAESALAPRDSAPATSDYPGCGDPAHDCRDGVCGAGPAPRDSGKEDRK